MKIPIIIDYSPRTALILGAVLSGGDAMALAKQLVRNDESDKLKVV
jgi:hypothetical protein